MKEPVQAILYVDEDGIPRLQGWESGDPSGWYDERNKPPNTTLVVLDRSKRIKKVYMGEHEAPDGTGDVLPTYFQIAFDADNPIVAQED